jgi:hypothetical protein
MTIRNFVIRSSNKKTCATACSQAVLLELPEKQFLQVICGTHIELYFHFVRSS